MVLENSSSETPVFTIDCTVPLPVFRSDSHGRLYDFREHPQVAAAFQLFSSVTLVSVRAHVSQAMSFQSDINRQNVPYRYGLCPRGTAITQGGPDTANPTAVATSAIGFIAGLHPFTVSHNTPSVTQEWADGSMPSGLQLDLRSVEVTHKYACFVVGRNAPIVTDSADRETMVRVQLDFTISCTGKTFGS